MTEARPDPRSDPPVGPPADRIDPARQLLQRLRGRPGSATAGSSRRRRPAEAGEYSGAGPDARDPQPMTTALGDLVAERGWERGATAGGLFARWPDLVGPEIAGHAHPESLTDGVLRLRADSTAWATQLRLLAPDLLRRITDAIGEGVVTEVSVVGPSAPSWRRGPRSVPGRGPRDTYG